MHLRFHSPHTHIYIYIYFKVNPKNNYSLNTIKVFSGTLKRLFDQFLLNSS